MLWVGERGVLCPEVDPQNVDLEDISEKLTEISFPMLNTFNINYDRPLHWLSNVSAPRLTMLSIQWEHQSDIELPTNLLFSPFPSIKHVHFRRTCDEEEIISLLKLMPNVTVANISPMATKSDFGLGLLRSLTETGNDTLLCPKLSYLVLGFPLHRIHTPKPTLEPEIMRLIQMEERFITFLQVFWSTGDGSREYASIPRTG